MSGGPSHATCKTHSGSTCARALYSKLTMPEARQTTAQSHQLQLGTPRRFKGNRLLQPQQVHLGVEDARALLTGLLPMPRDSDEDIATENTSEAAGSTGQTTAKSILVHFLSRCEKTVRYISDSPIRLSVRNPYLILPSRSCQKFIISRSRAVPIEDARYGLFKSIRSSSPVPRSSRLKHRYPKNWKSANAASATFLQIPGPGLDA